MGFVNMSFQHKNEYQTKFRIKAEYTEKFNLMWQMIVNYSLWQLINVSITTAILHHKRIVKPYQPKKNLRICLQPSGNRNAKNRNSPDDLLHKSEIASGSLMPYWVKDTGVVKIEFSHT